MNNTPVLTIGDAAGMLLGAGLLKLTENVNLGLLLLGVGVGLKVLIAFLQKYNVPVAGPSPSA